MNEDMSLHLVQSKIFEHLKCEHALFPHKKLYQFSYRQSCCLVSHTGMDIVLWTDIQTVRTKGTVWLRHLFCILYFF